jgi:hypothetical protein
VRAPLLCKPPPPKNREVFGHLCLVARKSPRFLRAGPSPVPAFVLLAVLCGGWGGGGGGVGAWTSCG